jgi:outer membrane phospholipase A
LFARFIQSGLSTAWIAFLIGTGALFFGSRAWSYPDERGDSLERFSAYRPSYFLVGNPDTKAQLSLKLQPIDDVTIYFGYSQLLMWELFHDSAPIRDINYNPEIFYRWVFKSDQRQLIDASPYEHESNGRSSIASRSWSRAYLRWSKQTQKMEWSFKVWSVYTEETRTLSAERGRWEVNVAYLDLLGEHWARSDFLVRIYPGATWGLNPLRGGQEMTIRLKVKAPHVLPLWVLQLFHGTGENLLNSNQEHTALRLGIGI